jgi:hypothetical protein
MKMEVVTTRLPINKIKLLELLSKKEYIDKSTMLRKLTLKAIDEYLLKNYISKYISGKISIYELSKEINMDLWELTDYLQENNIEQDITYEELKENEKNFNILCDNLKSLKSKN